MEPGDGVLLTPRQGWSGIQGVKQGLNGIKTFALVYENIGNLYEESKMSSYFKGKLQMEESQAERSVPSAPRIETVGARLLREQGL